MRVQEVGRVFRIPAQLPVLEGTDVERGLPFNNGRYRVNVHKLDRRGNVTGEMYQIASFAAPELAKQCRDRINAQNINYQAQVDVDERIADGDAVEEMYQRTWHGQAPTQGGPYYVAASFLDSLGRDIGSGAVSWFVNEASAQACADILNKENPAHGATIEKDIDFKPTEE